GDMPRRLISAEPLFFLHATLKGLSGGRDIFDPRALAEYERAASNPDVVAAWCADYTAAATLDLDHDRASLGQTREIPCLVLWGSKGAVDHHMDPVEAWQVWFPNARGRALDTGHFLVEEAPEQVLSALTEHLHNATAPQ
ncbi:MAG: alpha/beta hydrolase, partial [Pseudomonadota bacterium]